MASDFDPYHRWLGIPPEEQPPDHYRLLGVKRFETDPEVISNASDQRMTHLRTFASGQRGRDSQKLLNEVSAATRVLLDPGKRKEYDSELRAKEVHAVRAMPIAQAIPLSAAAFPPGDTGAAMQSALPMAMQIEQPGAAPGFGSGPGYAATPAFPGAAVNTGHRGPHRRKVKGNVGLVVGAIAGAVLLIGGALAAYQMSQPPAVVEKPPVVAPHKGPGKIKPDDKLPPVAPNTKGRDDEPGKAKPAVADTRAAFFYPLGHDGKSRGYYSRIDDKRWEQKEASGQEYNFDHVESTKEYVALHETRRGVDLRLYADHVQVRKAGAWTRAQSGVWVKPEDLARLMGPASQVIGSNALDHNSAPKFAFSGRNNARLASNLPLLSTDEPFTIDFWFRRGDDLRQPAGLLKIGQLSLSLGEGIINGKQTPWCEIHSEEKWQQQPHAVAADRQWHHFAVTYDDDRKLFVYLDGQRVLVESFSNFSVTELNPVEIGAARSHETDRTFQGQMHSLRFAEKSLFPGGQAFTPPSPKAMDLPTDVRLVWGNAGAPSITPMPTPRPVPRPTPVPSPVEVAPAKKPVPKEAELKTAQDKIDALYASKVKSAQKPEDKLRVSRELFASVAADIDDVTAYATLFKAQKLAALGGDVMLGLDVFAEIDRRYDLDRDVAKAAMLEDYVPRTTLEPAERETLVREAQTSALASLREENIAAAEKYAQVSSAASNKSKDQALKRTAKSLLEHIRNVKSAWEGVKESKAKLESAPDDAAANLALGRFYAFLMNDYPKASKHLAKSGQNPLADAARKELAVAGLLDDKGRLAAAEAWYAAIDGLKPAEKLSIQRHVLDTVQELEPKLVGLSKTRVSDLVKELKPIVDAADKANPLVTKPSKFSRGLIARLYAGPNRTIPTPFIALADGQQDLYRLNSQNLMRPYGTTYPRYDMFGVIKLEADADVVLEFDNCTAMVGPRLLHAVNGNPITLNVRMTKGTYPIKILTTNVGFEFRVADSSGMNLLMHDERVLESELERVILLPNGNSTKTQLLGPNRNGVN